MSLVHEALEKAAREKQRKSGTIPAPATSLAPAPKLVGVTTQPAAKPFAATPPPQPAKLPHILLTIVICCVGLVAIVAIVYLVIRATTTAPSTPATDGGARSVATVPAQGGLAVPAKSSPPEKPVVETPVPPIPAADTSAYKLSGIMKDPAGKYCAVLNGRVVYEDHYVDGATIKKIERDRVTLDINGRDTVLRLF